MRSRGTRTLTMAFLLSLPPLLFAIAELSWLFGPRAVASPSVVSTQATSVGAAAIVGSLVCPLVVMLLGVRLAREGHRSLGVAISLVAPALMIAALIGRIF